MALRLLRIAPDDPVALTYVLPAGLRVMAVFDSNTDGIGLSIDFQETSNGFMLHAKPDFLDVLVVCIGDRIPGPAFGL